MAKPLLTEAYRAWMNWGSEGKAKQLIATYSFIDGRLKKGMNTFHASTTARTVTSVGGSSSNHNDLDISTVIKAAQSIATETSIEELIKKV